MTRPILLAVTMVLLSSLSTWAQTIRLEAEDGNLDGVYRATTRPAFSGNGYVAGFSKKEDKIVLHFNAPSAGIYEMQIRYCSDSGKKGYELRVNGLGMSGSFARSGEEFTSAAAGRVELKEGENVIELESGWGHYEIDYIQLTLARESVLARPAKILCDAAATAEARTLMAQLMDDYGGGMRSGVYSDADAQSIHRITGRMPAILGGDLMDYSLSRVERGSHPGKKVEELIAAHRAGRIITVLWHWNAPTDLIDKMLIDERGHETNALWYKGFYTNATTFDLAKALSNEDSKEYAMLLRDIDAIAVQLKKFADARVPVLWRPLHEAEGGWFWWGAKGSEPFVKLWRLMYDRLTLHHHLHNLIWVYTSDSDPAWYPGDQYADIIGVDAYPPDMRDPLSASWEKLNAQFGGRKLLAITEFGGVPDVDRMHRLGARWAFFVSWNGEWSPTKLPPDQLRERYNYSGTINAESVKAP